MIDAAILGLISDTHGLLRSEALTAFEGCDLILHAGDIGAPKIIEQLSAIAPVIAIRGNVDTGGWAKRFPPTATVETALARIYMLHDVHYLSVDPAAGYHIIISGHSHKPAHTERNGVHYINPGSAGPRRFTLPTTVARIDLRQSRGPCSHRHAGGSLLNTSHGSRSPLTCSASINEFLVASLSPSHAFSSPHTHLDYLLRAAAGWSSSLWFRQQSMKAAASA
jgi:putative phosphoesterase